MRHVAPPIGVAETPRGLVVSLPPRFWLLVSLRQHFRIEAEPEAWTYCLRGANLARRLELWLAAIELQLAAERRRRAWSVTDAEWDGATAPTPPPAAAIDGEAFAAAIAAAAKPGIAGPTLRLLEAMRTGEVLTVTATGEGRTYRLSPSGRPVRASLAERAIGCGLLVPSCDGLFGPEWSQTWRAPAAEVSDAATNGGGARRAARGPAGQDHRSGTVSRAPERRPDRRAGQGAPRETVGNGRGPAAPRRRRAVA